MIIEPSQRRLKDQLRKEIRCKRAGLESSKRSRLDAAVNQYLVEHVRQMQPKVVAAYLAFDGEPDLAPAMEQLRGMGITLALPVVQNQPGKSIITFNHWSKDSGLTNNRYGIPEPLEGREIPPTQIDLVMVPLVAWDESGGRLGMGASFYDRYFQGFAMLANPVRIGVGYQLQQVDSLPLEPWDIRLHGVLSETGIFTFKE
ncbi:MAG: 5-formyltetrahydrofolate cyclo-ligase [Gammaproteobacteria bacterium]|jgi:5-formyltetrahydrofolate cyclo-ligase|nr:5-formyltetrahydrofolate cyclo-ligase [Gammaproteobacteria bacterium]